eukprot:TRINITY_DN14761_c0_g1_i2.p2 TRINITY_DN14761_c0_g1~~TRINITY_DN14761_c0_g1_i2.p2  ORF type:complete len:138 (-),score=9.85 TRINITY_DN14761_c0_g1_i2:18-431(-)
MDHVKASNFDGFYTYFASKGFTEGANPEIWSQLKKFATEKNLLFVPSVGPGYDDTRVRPWNNENTQSRSNGLYYQNYLDAVLKVSPPYVSITSFNEWHEGTQIESCQPYDTYQDYLPNSPTHYLELTASFVDRYHDP